MLEQLHAPRNNFSTSLHSLRCNFKSGDAVVPHREGVADLQNLRLLHLRLLVLKS